MNKFGLAVGPPNFGGGPQSPGPAGLVKNQVVDIGCIAQPIFLEGSDP